MKLLKWLINDFKTDYYFLRDVCKGKIDLEKRFKEIFNKENIIDGLKMCWIWFIIVILAFCCGYYVSQKSCQSNCNQFIYDNIVPECIGPVDESVLNFSLKLNVSSS